MTGRHRQARRPAPMRGLFGVSARASGAAAARITALGRVPLRSATGRLAATAVLGTTAVTAGAALAIAATLGGPDAGADSAVLTTGSREVAAGSAVKAAGSLPHLDATGSAIVRVPAGRHTGQTGETGRTAASRPSGLDQAGAASTPDAGEPVVGPAARRVVGRSVPTVRAGRAAGASAGAVVSASGTAQVQIRSKRRPRRVTADDVIRLARTQLGVREDAWGVTKYGVWYAATPRAAETARRDGGTVDAYRAAPWCDMFVSWLGSRTGTTPSVGSDAYTVEHARWFQQRRRWGGTPKAGALVFFDWNGKYSRDIRTIDHVGLVVKDNRNGTIQTIEGNTSDAVVLKNRPVTAVVGYGYPDFAH